MKFRDPRLAAFSARLAAPVARLYAHWLSVTGRVEAAERVLRRAAENRAGSFATAIAHAKVLLALGRENDARSALRRACRIAPDRFLRRRDLPAALREVVAVECILADKPASERARYFPAETPSRAPASFLGRVGTNDPPPTGSDFTTGTEARRFQGMDPLDKTSAKDVDWDDLLHRLARPAQPGGPRGS